MSAVIQVVSWALAMLAGACWSAARAAERERVQLSEAELAAELVRRNGLGLAIRLHASPLRGLIYALAPEGDQ